MSFFAPPGTRSNPSDNLTQLMVAGYYASHRDEKPRDYLGASCWGDECRRKLAYVWHKLPTDPECRPIPKDGDKFNIDVIVEMGKVGEAIGAAMVRSAGFDLLTEKKDGKQFGFYVADGKMRGHCDGIITGGPDTLADGRKLEFPIVWENKMLNNKNWNLVRNQGYKKAKPIYYAQINVYGAYFDIPNGGLVTCINRDSGMLLTEFIPFDERVAQESSDKAIDVIESSAPEEFPRLSKDQNFFACIYCDFRQRCHGIPDGVFKPKEKIIL